MRLRRKYLPTVIGAGVMLAVMTTLVAYAPTLYRLFCGATGAAGTTQRANAASVTSAGTSDVPITVFFDSNVAPGLDWSFRPEQRKVRVRPGVPTKIYYEATNLSDEPIVGHATYNVTPYQVAPYFFKIQCFCFTNERLGPHETAKMPVLFYIDKHMLKDSDVHAVRQVTLSYTFFKQKDLDAGDIASARDLKGGSQELDKSLDSTKASYDNDAPRR
jgi:cytochrome c oxidase assembly protein subunit 11